MRTQNLLKTGLIELMQEKPVQQITVKELVEHVDLNRGTFYLHYKDIFDLLEQIEDELLENFREILNANPVQKLNGQPLPMLRDIFELLEKHAAFTKMVLGSGHEAHFIAELKSILKEKCFADWNYLLKSKEPETLEFFYSYCISGCIGLIENWISGDIHRSADEMADIAAEFVLHGFQAMASL